MGEEGIQKQHDPLVTKETDEADAVSFLVFCRPGALSQQNAGTS